MAAGLLGNKLKFMIKTILIVGCGSIGRRHARNAKIIGIKNIILCDSDIRRVKKFASDLGTNLIYTDYKEAVNKNPEIEAAVIATPSNFHIEPALFFAERRISVFIEKPLSNNLDNVEKLIKTVQENKVVAMMGQCYRFHEGFLKLKEILDKGFIGKIYHVSYLSGQYLPDWHPEGDYRKEYAALLALGGGVFLTSASHGFDNIQWLFGDIKEIVGWKAKLSDLGIETEDAFFTILKTDRNIIVQYQADFLQRKGRSQMIVIGEKGLVEADFIKNEIIFQTVGQEKPEVVKYDCDPNKKYFCELKLFSKLIENKKISHSLDLNVGKRILELMLSEKVVFIR